MANQRAAPQDACTSPEAENPPAKCCVGIGRGRMDAKKVGWGISLRLRWSLLSVFSANELAGNVVKPKKSAVRILQAVDLASDCALLMESFPHDQLSAEKRNAYKSIHKNCFECFVWIRSFWGEIPAALMRAMSPHPAQATARSGGPSAGNPPPAPRVRRGASPYRGSGGCGGYEAQVTQPQKYEI